MQSTLVHVYKNNCKQKYVNYRLRACGRVISGVSKDRDACVLRISQCKSVDEHNCQHGCRAVLYTVPLCHHKTPNWMASGGTVLHGGRPATKHRTHVTGYLRREIHLHCIDRCNVIHSVVFRLRGRVGRNQSPVMWPVWLLHTTSWASSWG